MSVLLTNLMTVDQYLYRYFGADGTLLYTGVSDDWTRRLRQHWLGKQWAADILSVTLETYPNRPAVLTAERKAIKAEKPLYNIQHNHHGPAPEDAASTLTAADIILIAALAVAAGIIIYQMSQAAIEKYRAWKADRDEFREWQNARRAEKNEPGHDDSSPGDQVVSPTAVLRPAAAPPGGLTGAAFTGAMAFYANMPRPADRSRSSAPPPQDETTPA